MRLKFKHFRIVLVKQAILKRAAEERHRIVEDDIIAYPGRSQRRTYSAICKRCKCEMGFIRNGLEVQYFIQGGVGVVTCSKITSMI